MCVWQSNGLANVPRIILYRLFWCLLSVTTVASSAMADSLLFRQPSLTQILGNFCVRCAAEPGRFHITQWESNPGTASGEDIQSNQNMAPHIGLRRPSEATQSQVSLSNKPGASGLQVSGEAVGAFISSTDVAPDTPQQKFIITPSIEFTPPVTVFKKGVPSSGLEISFDLQVPAATDQHKPNSSAYVVSDLMFRNKSTGRRVYVNTIIFKNNVSQPKDFSFFDGPTSTAAAVGPITGGTEFSQAQQTSQPYQNAPWRGWRHFSYVVSAENLLKAIASVNRHYGNLNLPEESSEWELMNWHLNAEILFGDGPSELGWSLRHTSITERDR